VHYDVLFYWNHLENRNLENTFVVVADVLRATTVMAHALHHGAKAVWPQSSDDEARKLYHDFQQLGEPVLLCGEKEGFKREGYDLGNSPLEFTPNVVRGKAIIHLTTNGTKALRAASRAKQVFIASFANLSAVADLLRTSETEVDEILFVVSGREGQYCIEDTVCLGGVLSWLLGPPGGEVDITDAGRTAIDLYQIYRGNILSMLQQCFHGRYLAQVGLGSDLPVCSQVDVVTCVPYMQNGKIVV